MLKRVIEERAAGYPTKAEAIRSRCVQIIGDSLSDLVPGSNKSERVKKTLLEDGLWSQYLEVGIGPDAEVFTKAQPLSAVGHGAAVGLHTKPTLLEKFPKLNEIKRFNLTMPARKIFNPTMLLKVSQDKRQAVRRIDLTLLFGRTDKVMPTLHF